jgi:hypothetical protein
MIPTELPLPEGLIPVDQSIILPNVSGYDFGGQGQGDFTKHPGLRGKSTYLVAKIEEEVIRVNGCDQYIHDFTIYGEGSSAGILLAFKAGVGTGGMTVERVSARGGRCAWQQGLGTGPDKMCDTSVWRDSTWQNLDFGVESNQAMSMSNSIEGITASMIRNALWRVNGGGNFAIRDCRITRVDSGLDAEGNRIKDEDICAVYSFADSKKIGSNNNCYLIANFKADSQCGDRLELIRMDEEKDLNITVLASQVANDSYSPGHYLWNLCNGANISIVGGSGLLQRNSFFARRPTSRRPKPIPVVYAMGTYYNETGINNLLQPGSGPIRLVLNGEHKILEAE